MKYSKLSKTSKCIIASTLLTSAAVATIVPIITYASATTTNTTTNNDQKIQTGKIIHNASTRVVNNINELQIESVNTLSSTLSDIDNHSNSAIVNNNGVQEIYVWGLNAVGQLGIGNTTNQSSPVKFDLSIFGQYDSLDFNIASNSSASSYAIVNSIRGQELYMWGRNDYGQLGVGSTTNQVTPILINKSQLGNYDSIESIKVTYYTIFIITIKNGQQQLFSCGANSFGELGIGNAQDQNIFQLITPSRLGNYTSIEKITLSNSFRTASASALVNTTTGLKLYVWGYNGLGQLGTGNTTATNTLPILLTNQIFSSDNLVNLKYDINLSSYALNMTTNQLYTWGDNQYGQLGLNDLTNRASPVIIPASRFDGIILDVQVGQSSYATVLSATGTKIYVWGLNTSGELGVGNTTNQQAPILFDMSKVGNPTAIKKFNVHSFNSSFNNSFGSYALVEIKGKLELYVWGNNGNGQLGLGNTSNISVPIKPTLPIDSRIIDANISTTSWINLIDNKGQSKYYVSGINTSGQFGLANTTSPTTFVETLPTTFTAFTPSEFISTRSAPDALNYLKADPNRIKEFINFLDVPANTVIGIDNTSTADFKTGILNLTFSSTLTNPPLSSIAQTTNSKYTLQLQFQPVTDAISNPPTVYSNLPTGISEAQTFYDQITFADGTVKNRYLLAKYVDLSSIPEFYTVNNINVPVQLLVTPNSQPNDIHKIDFALTTSAIYDATGNAVPQIKTYNLTIDLPYIDWGLILGLSIPGGLLLIGGIIFTVWYFKYRR